MKVISPIHFKFRTKKKIVLYIFKFQYYKTCVYCVTVKVYKKQILNILMKTQQKSKWLLSIL